jgi:hypothetical protein
LDDDATENSVEDGCFDFVQIPSEFISPLCFAIPGKLISDADVTTIEDEISAHSSYRAWLK